MSILRSLVHSRPTETRSVDSIAELLARARGGVTWAGVSVSDESALGNAAVWACERLLTDTIAQLPVAAYRENGGVQERLPVQPRIVDMPSGVLTRQEWVGQLAHSAISEGNGYAQVAARDERGFATQAEVRRTADVAVFRSSPTGPPVYKADNLIVDAADMVHVRGLMRAGDVCGRSAVFAARQTIGLGLSAEEYGARFFGDGAHPTTVWVSDQTLTDVQAATMKDRIKEVMGRTRDPLVVGAGTKPHQLQQAPGDSNLVEVQRWAVEQVCRFFGIPPEMIGGASSGSSVTYANREQRALDFVTFAVTPWLSRIEAAWSALLPAGTYVRFTVDGLLRSDTTARYNAHASAIRAGWRSRDEVRRLENLAPVPDGSGSEFLWPPYRSAPLESDKEAGE